MPIIEPKFSPNKTAGGFKQFEEAILKDGQISVQDLLKNKYERSNWEPTDDEMDMRKRILKDMMIGMTNMWAPRVELNDLSVIQRMQVDQMSWNTYQPNNGLANSEDDIQGWRSNAMRPVVRNKCVSIAAHATARLIFPKVFATSPDNEDEREAAQVMEDLMEWAAEESNYKKTALYRVITALTDPASIGYTEYSEVFKSVKDEKVGGKWKYKVIPDETFPCFQDYTVPVDELYIENFYEPDIQKQGFLIWRKVISYSLAKAKYGGLYENFNKYVKPGVQTIYSDANQAFYFVYDPLMRPYDVEEVIYWNKQLDVKIIMVNGVILTDFDNPNPRLDKQYPFDKFGYELINNRCFYYKSLAFKTMQDANIINTLYPMIIDGTYLSIMPPMVNKGTEAIGADVIVPGMVTNLSSPDASLQPVMQNISNNLKSGLDSLQKVEDSLSESSQSETQQGQADQPGTTAYEISRLEQNAATVLGLFVQMIAQHVRDFGKLRLGDILQYLTIADLDAMGENKNLSYKTFILRDVKSGGSIKSKKIKFDNTLPSEALSPEEKLKMSYDVLQEQGGLNSHTELYKVNPELFRNLKYSVAISPDVLNPKSEDLERAYGLEFYDRAILNPTADQEQVFRRLLLTDPEARRDPDRYIRQQGTQQNPMQGMQPGQNPMQPGQPPQSPQNGSGKPGQPPVNPMKVKGIPISPQSAQPGKRTVLPQVPNAGVSL